MKNWIFDQFGLSRYQWCRKWYGGRWELWHIGICNADIWLRIPMNYSTDYRQPCSVGPRIAQEVWSVE